ncbi:hypothetical protein AgCh_000074 [Apium graveolens]
MNCEAATDFGDNLTDMLHHDGKLRHPADAKDLKAMDTRMEEQCYNLRFFYLGKFQNSEYIGGKDGLIAGVKPDRFSYTVLMEHVKDDLKYSEIGGIYIKSDEVGGWKMVSRDKYLPLLDKDMDFYVDNVVDPKIEPLQQMQPHKRQGEDENIDEDETMDEKDIQDASLPPPPPLPSPLKLMTVYEYNKWLNVLKNNEKMNELGLPKLATNMVAGTEKNKGKETMQDPDEYIPDDGEQSNEDSSQVAVKEKPKKVKKSKTQSGRRPTTPSVANPVTTTEEGPTGNDTNVKQAGKLKIVEPNIQIQLSCIEGLGMMVDYFALRERKQKEAANDVELKVWALKTILHAWRGNKSQTKCAHYLAFATDEERLANNPNDIPAEDFKVLLKYWGDPEIQKKKLVADAQASDVQASDAQASDLQASDTQASDEIIEKKIAASEPLDGIKELLSGGKSSHGPGWLIGRHDVKALKNSTPQPSNACLQDLTKKIRQNIVQEVKEKFNRKLSDEVAKVKKVQDNMSLVLQKLLEANPGLNIDIAQIYGTISSDTGADGTPLTDGRST